jgi:alkanesulfonate monooxygenase SsuD/methylene tetrahydromethanopterin reductase-like flavin-dependent oxidoreductase (luciferase family)
VPTSATTIRFGIFDWVDAAGHDLAEQYEWRLRLIELADRSPFWCYHVAEHHGTPLGLVPSPNVFLAAAASRTRRLRLGPLVNVLPLYDPVRLVEEICMLDHLSRGRLELGLGRGGVPGELAPYGVRAEDTREIFQEGLGLVLQGLREGRFDHRGRWFAVRSGTTPLRPLQRPYPPLWYPTSFPSSVPWIAREGISVLFAFLLARQQTTAAEQVERYRGIQREHVADPDRLNGHVAEPCVGVCHHVVVAETDAEAQALARRALREWFASFNHLWLREHGTEYFPSDVDAFIGAGHALVGSPESVREQVRRVLVESGGNYFAGVFAFGDLSQEAALRSLDLFARRVIPGLIAGDPPGG